MEVKQLLERELDISFSTRQNKGNDIYYGKYEGCTINIFHTGKVSVQGNEPKKSEVEKNIELLLGEKSNCQVQSKEYRLFIVYGHDRDAREQLEHICHQLDVKAEKVTNDSGMTIIEALEKKIEKISAGIVLLTPDDIFASKKDYKVKGPSCLQEQARQNVVLEMGMLMAKLGRDRVIILEKGDVKEPSDINGVFSLRFKDHVRETLPTLVKRLRVLGFGIDTDKALSILE